MQYEIKILNTLEAMLGYHAFIQHLYPKMSVAQYETLLKEMVPNNYHQVVVLENNEPVGLAGFWINTRLWCGKYIDADNVIVHPDYRSKGIGKILMHEIEKEGTKLGCNIAVLDVYVDNFKAQKFYYREGYIARGYHFLKPLHLKVTDARNLWND
jgi:ribosomal protein S18 acetylase RimI-like enzyme